VAGDVTTGAQNDIERATTIAQQMVTEWGMSERLGPRRFGHPHGEVFLGRDFTSRPDYSEEIAASIDEEVRVLIDAAHDVARSILTDNRAALDRLAADLMEHETLEADQVVQALEDVTPWTHRHDVGGTRPSAVATNEHPSPGPVPPGRSPTGRNNP
jgi:cell division protease FtsH